MKTPGAFAGGFLFVLEIRSGERKGGIRIKIMIGIRIWKMIKSKI